MAKGHRDKLTFRQESFVAEFLKDRNATQAAIRAGYAESSATSLGLANLRNPLVNAKIKELTEANSTHAGVDAEFVLRELKRVAEQEDVAQSTKVRALELIAKHLGMLEERLTVKTDSLSPEQRAERVAILIERASRRGELP
jgi:phage terminase small subunit